MRSILLVDDDADLRLALRDFLTAEKFVVHTARDGQHAQHVLDKIDPPNLILLDYKMPIMDGKQFLSMMRRVPRLQTIPVVIGDRQVVIGERAANREPDNNNDQGGGTSQTKLGIRVQAITPDMVRGRQRSHATRSAMRASWAAKGGKYYWLAPRMLAIARQQRNRASYDNRDLAAMFAGRAPVLEQVTRWARSALS